MWASWEHLLDPALEKAKFYYNSGWMRVEMSPVGPSHAQDNGLVAPIIAQWLLIRALPLSSYINVTLRKSGLQEAQPDLADFAGQADRRPARSNTPTDLGTVLPPVLAIEISASTLADDLDAKRELYARLGVGEYWVVDVEAVEVRMFATAEDKSALVPVPHLRVLAGLESSALAEALRRGRGEGDASAMRYIAGIV
ncbi:MAG: Uma2 family endonuclease [Aphanocapsa lilacina HA4352-LM1]|nr:Uma2 family endonuclease [Aphanocapsa lilacina HA4352-LM1]